MTVAASIPLSGRDLIEVAGMESRPIHDNFVTLIKWSCHFPELPIRDVTSAAQADDSSIGQVDMQTFSLSTACLL
jgi:hypothetical protein